MPMRKLYKTILGSIHYKEAWADEADCTYHWGVLGRKGKTKSIPIKRGETPEDAVNRALADALTDGYLEIPHDQHSHMVIQFKTDHEWGDSDDLEKRHMVDGLMDECLGWTGNGHCDGGDIGSGTINTFVFVVDAETATKTITSTLRSSGILNDALIALQNSDDEFEVVWPKNYDQPFSTI